MTRSDAPYEQELQCVPGAWPFDAQVLDEHLLRAEIGVLLDALGITRDHVSIRYAP